MSARHFDRHRVRAVRRAAEIPQADVAATVGVSDSAVAGWETGSAAPDPEKLPALARALKQDLDDLFPRTGPPDLTDLRCDAGYYQYETAALIGTKSAGPVAGAERGVRRLKDKYVPVLATAYGVRVEALLRAQERSFGIDAPEPGQRLQEPTGTDEGLPETLAQKITYLLERLPAPLSDAEIAALGNSRTGHEALSENLVRDLRTGLTTSASQEALHALAEALDTTPLIWSDDADVQRIIAETLLLRGQIAAMAARGGEQEGLSAELLQFISREVDKARAEARGLGGEPSALD
ncbi:helix-turn-helix transcriptional regulator [Streptomyces sp. NPDC001340]